MLDLTTINKNTFSNKNKEEILKKVFIISSRSHVRAAISTQLRLTGNYEFVFIKSSFFEEFESGGLASAEYIVVDIENIKDIMGIEHKVKFSMPIAIRKIFVGDVDSISFYNEMKRIGINYLHIDSQIMHLGKCLSNETENDNSKTQILKISIIGCKGGSGTSLVSWWFFQAMGELSQLPVLLVQGHTGSSDLDLISDSSIQRDGGITSFNEHQALKIETEENPWDFDEPNFKNYNIVIFDHNVTTQVRDKLEIIAPNSNYIFIVVTRELSSVRNARLIIDELERAKGSASVTKNIIILNENIINKPGALSNEDIENYLSRNIDMVSPYRKDIKTAERENEIYDFVANMLGKKNIKKSGRWKILNYRLFK